MLFNEEDTQQYQKTGGVIKTGLTDTGQVVLMLEIKEVSKAVTIVLPPDVAADLGSTFMRLAAKGKIVAAEANGTIDPRLIN